MKVTATQVIDALKDTRDVRDYSGRGMYGAHCVGVDAERPGDIMGISADLIRAGLTADDLESLGDALCTDGMGRGIIVYWPALKLTAEQVAALGDDDDDEEED